MKYSYLIFFIGISLFNFSCKGMSKRNNELPFQKPFVETVEETFEYPVTEDFSLITREFPADEYLDSDELLIISHDEIDNETENDENPNDFFVVVNEEEAGETEFFTELTEELRIEDRQEEYAIAEDFKENQTEVIPAAQQDAPASSPVPAQQSVQPAPAQLVQQPVVQPPAQPVPVQTPVQLAPAEEISPLERESAANVPLRDFPQNVLPVQTAVIPQDAQNDEIIFSRTVHATVGQTIEIPFHGTRWIYLEDPASRRGIAYDSRRFDSGGQSFIFRAEEAGTYTLKFFRQDFTSNYTLNDYVQVIVGESPDAGGEGWFSPPVDRGRVTAQPRWPSAANEAEIQTGGSGPVSALGATSAGSSSALSSGATLNAPSAQGFPQETTGTPSSGGIASLYSPSALQTNSQPSAVSEPSLQASSLPSPAALDTEILPPGVLLQNAKELFDEGNVSGAIALLDQFGKYYPSETDELYWLYGQFYEANTPSRNILLSLDYYRRLTNEFPQSSRYNDARSRIAYLERFYIQIR